MKNFTLLLLLACFLGATQLGFSQRCGTQILHHQKMHNDPAYKARYNAYERQIGERMKTSKARANCASPTFFPVAIHFDWTPSAAEQAELIKLANNQIATLNATFNSNDCQGTTNANCYEFKLATNNHPTGSGLTEGNPAVTFGGTAGADYCAVDGSGDSQPCNLSRWTGYMNITVNRLSAAKMCSSLGISHLVGNPTTLNSMSVNACAFGAVGIQTLVADATGGANCSCLASTINQGKTVPHEIGHFLGLFHTFCGDGGGSSTVDGSMTFAQAGACQQNGVCASGCVTSSCDCDMIADTPAQAWSTSGCPGGSASATVNNPSTSSPYAFNNFMDYTDDACMNCFSQGQYTRIASTLISPAAGASDYKTKAQVCPPVVVTPPTTTVPPTVANPPSIADPCNCTDPLNQKSALGAVTRFHDVLTVMGTAGHTVVLKTGGANFTNAAGVQIPDGTSIGPIPAGGTLNYDFYHASGASGSIVLTINGVDAAPFPISVCSASSCVTTTVAPIPTMSEWGLLIFGLLVLNLGVIFLYKRETIFNN